MSVYMEGKKTTIYLIRFFLHGVRNFYNFSTKVTGFVVCFLGGMNERSNLAHLNSDYT